MADLAKIGRILQLTGGVIPPEQRQRNALMLQAEQEQQQAEKIAQLEAKRAAREFIQSNLSRLPQGDPRRSRFQENFDRLNTEIAQLGGESLPEPVSEVKSPAQVRAESKAKESGKLEARRENIDRILNRGAQQTTEVGEGTVVRPGQQPGRQIGRTPAAEVFAAEGDASPDAQRVNDLFLQASLLAEAGETTQANALLSQARFLADNSSEIQRQKELNKPISRQMASRLGVPIGTTFQEVLGATVPTPEEEAESVAEASAIGRGRVESREQLGFINQAETIIENFEEELEADPGIAGIRGSLRSTGKRAKNVLEDLDFTGLLERAQDLAMSQSEMNREEVEGLFDNPQLSALDLMENTLGMIWARVQNPTGRLQVSVIERSIDDMQLKGLIGTQDVKDRLSFIKNALRIRRQSISQRFDTDQSEEAPSESRTDLPRYRVVDGQLQRVE